MGFQKKFIKENSRYLLPRRYLRKLIEAEDKLAEYEALNQKKKEQHKKDIKSLKNIIRAINGIANAEYQYECSIQDFLNNLEKQPIFDDGICDLIKLVDAIKKYNISSIEELTKVFETYITNQQQTTKVHNNFPTTLNNDTKEMRWKLMQVALVNPHITSDWSVKKIFDGVEIGISYDGILSFAKKYGDELSLKYGKLPYNEHIKAKSLLRYMCDENENEDFIVESGE